MEGGLCRGVHCLCVWVDCMWWCTGSHCTVLQVVRCMRIVATS